MGQEGVGAKGGPPENCATPFVAAGIFRLNVQQRAAILKMRERCDLNSAIFQRFSCDFPALLPAMLLHQN